MTDYYFFTSTLPRLQIGYPPDLNFHDFSILAKENLKASDYDKVIVIQTMYDLYNLLMYWKDEEFILYGSMDEKQLEEAIVSGCGLQEYVYHFIEKYDSQVLRIKHFNELLIEYFNQAIDNSSGFLNEYLTFEREWRLVVTGFRAKKLGHDIAVELQHEDPNDELVGQILAQRDAPAYEPPTKYHDLKGLFEEHYNAPLELYQALCEWRFEKLREMIAGDLFTIDRILGFMAQLILVENWMALDEKKGCEIVDQLLGEAS